jgi:hypothetical protein
MSEAAKDYSRGYRAGKRLAVRAAVGRTVSNEISAFMKEVFLAALGNCITAQNWKTNEKDITSLTDRVKLAWDFAREAERQRPSNARPSIVIAEEDSTS